MQYQATSPKQYLSLLDDDWRKSTLTQLRQFIVNHPANLTESINYKMLAYGHQENFVFHLNAQKHFVALYVGNIAKVQNANQFLSGLDCGKGCIRFKKKDEITTDITRFIDQAINQWHQGDDTSC